MSPPRPNQHTEDRRPLFRRAYELVRAGHPAEADTLVRESATKPSKDAEGLRVRARLAIHAGRPGEARSHAERSLKIEPHADAWLVLADLHLRMDEIEDGVAAALQAAACANGDDDVLLQSASILLRIRRRTEADRIIAPLIATPPTDAGTHRRYVVVRASMWIQDDRPAEAIEPLRNALTTASLAPERRAILELLAQSLERCGHHDDAFAAATDCQDLERARFDPARHATAIDRIIAEFTREAIAEFPPGCDDDRPVFIAGMPRSGTSLVDRIIDAHPDATGIGELPLLERVLARGLDRPNLNPIGPDVLTPAQREQWPRIAEQGLRVFDELAPGASRVAGKSLGNPRLLGLAASLYPRARIVHVLRDPRDVAISCHFGRFRTEAIPYASRLEWVAAAWRDHDRLMAHWRATLDVPIHVVHYERLVANPEREFPRLIEFLGLDWNDRCLAFHESERPLQTLSVDQVARPVHTGSVGRHRDHAARVDVVEWPSYAPDDRA